MRRPFPVGNGLFDWTLRVSVPYDRSRPEQLLKNDHPDSPRISAGSVRSNRHLGSKFGQPDAEQPFPLTGTRKRSGFAKAYDWVLASWDWLPAPGEAVMARPMTVATHAAAAVLTMGLLMMMGLNIRSPCSSWQTT